MCGNVVGLNIDRERDRRRQMMDGEWMIDLLKHQGWDDGIMMVMGSGASADARIWCRSNVTSKQYINACM